MKIEDLTIGEAKEIATLFNNVNSKGSDSNITDEAIGKYAIIRTRNEGVNFGKVLKADSTGVVLGEAQRLYEHKPKDNNMSWYEGVSMSGLHSDSILSTKVDTKIIIEDYSITLCTEEAVKSIKEHKPNGS